MKENLSLQGKQVVVKNYEYILKNLLMIYFCVFVCLFFVLWPFPIGKIICGSLAALSLSWAVCLPYFSKTYDVISSEGIKRVKKGVVLFELPWNDITSISYLGFKGMVILSRNVLYIFPKEDKCESLPSNLQNHDSKIGVSIQLSRRKFEYIDQTFIPANVRRLK